MSIMKDRYATSGRQILTSIYARSAVRTLQPKIFARGPAPHWPPSALQEFEDFDTKAAAKRNITKAIERVAQRLGNTKAVCRKCYIHPAVIDAYMDRSLVATLKQRTEAELRESLPGLPAEEAAVLALVQQRMERQLRGLRNHRNGRKKPRMVGIAAGRKSSVPAPAQRSIR